MPAKRKQTLAEIVAEVRAAPPTPAVVRPGAVNVSGQFFDLAGALLTSQRSIDPAQAAALVADGALVAFEGCGCGGFGAGCQPEWADESARARLASAGSPRFVKGFGSPTWIDEWSSESSTVVFLHGDVKWGDEY